MYQPGVHVGSESRQTRLVDIGDVRRDVKLLQGGVLERDRVVDLERLLSDGGLNARYEKYTKKE